MPAPPLSPVVSRSKKMNGARAAATETSGAEPCAASSRSASSPIRQSAVPQLGVETPDDDERPPAGALAEFTAEELLDAGPAEAGLCVWKIRLELDSGGEVRSEPEATFVRTTSRKRSARFMRSPRGGDAGGRRLVQHEVENPECSRFRQRTGIAERSDTSRTTVLALAFRNQPPGLLEQGLDASGGAAR